MSLTSLMTTPAAAQPPAQVPQPPAEDSPPPGNNLGTVPPVRQQGQIAITIKNGARTIRIVRDDAGGQSETIESQDKNGKEISVRHTHQVNGKEVAEIYEADNLDDLKKKHPAGATLFQELLQRAELQARLNQNLQRLAPGVPQPQIGDRRIRGMVLGHVVEITDRHGQQIRMRVRSRSAPPDQVQEYQAENIGELRRIAPEASTFYERLAGIR